jgi:hypothetical protein
MFMLSFSEILKGVRKRLDFFPSHFCWQSDGHKKKYMLTKWNLICQPKDQGRFGDLCARVKKQMLVEQMFIQADK